MTAEKTCSSPVRVVGVGPLGVGVLHDLTGDCTGMFALAGAAVLGLPASGWLATRPRVVDDEAPGSPAVRPPRPGEHPQRGPDRQAFHPRSGEAGPVDADRDLDAARHAHLHEDVRHVGLHRREAHGELTDDAGAPQPMVVVLYGVPVLS